MVTPQRWLCGALLLLTACGDKEETNPSAQPSEEAGASAHDGGGSGENVDREGGLPTGASNDAGAEPEIPPVSSPPSGGLEITSCEHTGSGEQYDVGPGQPYEAIGEVPLADLGPGDTVRIHFREEPYREVLHVSARGTEEDPVRICGVRGPGGQRPVIDGQDAVVPASSGMKVDWANIALVLFSHKETDDYETHYPEHVILEGLDIQGAKLGVPLTDRAGNSQEFYNASSCIAIHRGKNLVIRDNEISECGFGIFTRSTNRESEQITDLVIEGNYIHHNNTTDESLTHNVYIQAFGVLYQFNHFGSPYGSNNIKDRSVGAVIRYNWIEPAGAMNLDLVEAEEHKQTAAEDPRYRTTVVYGNLIHQVYGSTPVHYGADHLESDNIPYFRKGTLHFYHNTLVIEDPEEDRMPWRRALFRVTTVEEKVAAFNNIFDYRGEAVNFELMGVNDGLLHLEQGGHFVIGKNWIPEGWTRNSKDEEAFFAPSFNLGEDGELGILEGEENFISEPSEPVDRESFAPAEALADLAEPVPAELVDAGHGIEYQYDVTVGDPTQPLTQIRRRQLAGRALALGAVEERE